MAGEFLSVRIAPPRLEILIPAKAPRSLTAGARREAGNDTGSKAPRSEVNHLFQIEPIES